MAGMVSRLENATLFGSTSAHFLSVKRCFFAISFKNSLIASMETMVPLFT